jgi:serine/threonine-protein kinase
VVEALTALAAVRGLYDWDWAGAERDFGRALDVQPTHAQTHQWLATHLLTPLRRFDEARGALAEAASLDPLSPVVAASRGIISLYAGETPRAIEELSHAAELYPEFGLARFFLGMAYQEAGDSGRAQEVLEQALVLTNRSNEVLAALAHAQALASGQRPPAADELERRAADHYVSPALVAQVRLGMGDHEAALELLEAAADERSLDLVWLGVRPVYAPLRPAPRFRALLDRVGLGGG